MIGLTIFVALVAIALVLLLPPPTALGILIGSMMLYPEYLRIPLGPIKMSVPRLVALVLVIRLAGLARQRGFKWRTIDTLVCLEWVWAVTANLLAQADQSFISEMVGRIFDTIPLYFAARLCLPRTEEYRKLLAPAVVCAVIAGGLGAFEAVTHIRPYAPLQAYSAIQGFDFGGASFADMDEIRYGLLRARGSTAMSLYFGVAMFLLMGILYSLKNFARYKTLWAVGLIAAFAGTLSSMSSGPQSALVSFLLVASFYFFPSLIKPALGALAALVVFCEFASNRQVWFLIDYLNPLGGDSYYRSQLISVAISQWHEYWLIGVGSKIPSHWGMLIDGRQFVDIVNEFIIVAVTTGFLGLGLRLGIYYQALRDAIRTYRHGDPQLKHFVFAQAATLIALSLAGMSTGFFGPARLLEYVLLGMMVRPASDRLPRRVRQKGRPVLRRVPRQANVSPAGIQGAAAAAGSPVQRPDGA